MAIVHDRLSNNLKQLFELGADMAIELIENENHFLPFMFKQKENTKEHIVFTGEGELNKKAMQQALKSTVHDLATLRFVLVYPGILSSPDGHKSHAVILEGSEKGLDAGFVFAQRYQQNKNGSYSWLDENCFIKLTDRLRMQ